MSDSQVLPAKRARRPAHTYQPPVELPRPKKAKEDRFGSGRIFGTYLFVASEGRLRVGETLKVTPRTAH